MPPKKGVAKASGRARARPAIRASGPAGASGSGAGAPATPAATAAATPNGGGNRTDWQNSATLRRFITALVGSLDEGVRFNYGLICELFGESTPGGIAFQFREFKANARNLQKQRRLALNQDPATVLGANNLPPSLRLGGQPVAAAAAAAPSPGPGHGPAANAADDGTPSSPSFSPIANPNDPIVLDDSNDEDEGLAMGGEDMFVAPGPAAAGVPAPALAGNNNNFFGFGLAPAAPAHQGNNFGFGFGLAPVPTPAPAQAPGPVVAAAGNMVNNHHAAFPVPGNGIDHSGAVDPQDDLSDDGQV